MFIYSEHIGPRHEYVARLLTDRLGLPFSWVSDKAFIDNDPNVLIYSKTPVEGKLVVYNSGFLDETTLRSDLPQFQRTLFPVLEDGFAMDFDVFSAAFYVVSRYEEYIIKERDKHNRFKPENSILYQLKLLDRPVVDEWIYQLGSIIKEKLGVDPDPPDYSFKPTFDIDVAYAYMGRPFWLSMAAYANDLFQRNFSLIKQRFRVNTGLQPDPYDTYEILKSLCVAYKVKPTFFFQLGVRDTFDKNLYPLQPLIRDLINGVDDWADVGIHPSYRSNTDEKSLEYELQLYEKVLYRPAKLSRQHYLKLTLPETLLKLERSGIKEEYSMGYARKAGFRAGTCHAFPFFNVLNNDMTELLVKPFMVMDGTLKDHLNLSVEDAKFKADALIKQVKVNHGEFIFIWHNSSFGNIGNWQRWNVVLQHIFKSAGE